MRKLVALLSVFIIVFAMSVPVQAASESTMTVIPSLTFNGTTATCSLDVYAERTTDSIEATVVLKNGTIPIKQWPNMTANGYMIFSDTAYVTSGCTYTMQVTLKINGVSYAVADITKVCP